MGISLQFVAGSSPLARGLPVLGPVERRFGRIIPARAGFTDHPGRVSALLRDHPRSRGVYEQLRLAYGDLSGSSPLARGLPMLDLRLRIADRIIPARAGFTVNYF